MDDDRLAISLYCFLRVWYGQVGTDFLERYGRAGDGWIPPFITPGIQERLKPLLGKCGVWRGVVQEAATLTESKREKYCMQFVDRYLRGSMPGETQTKAVIAEEVEENPSGRSISFTD